MKLTSVGFLQQSSKSVKHRELWQPAEDMRMQRATTLRFHWSCGICYVSKHPSFTATSPFGFKSSRRIRGDVLFARGGFVPNSSVNIALIMRSKNLACAAASMEINLIMSTRVGMSGCSWFKGSSASCCTQSGPLDSVAIKEARVSARFGGTNKEAAQ